MVFVERGINPRKKIPESSRWDSNPRPDTLAIKPLENLEQEWKTIYIAKQHCLEASAECQLILTRSRLH